MYDVHHPPAPRGTLITAVAVTGILLLGAARPSGAVDVTDYRGWIAAMQADPRGPFARIRWFCKDGTVLPPEQFACKTHGGGVQHGEWSERTRALRDAGFLVGNVLASADIETLARPETGVSALDQLLIEQFLIGFEDGWILRQARYYRGAFQDEDERAAATRLLVAMAGDEAWLGRRFLELRTTAALLSHGTEAPSAAEIRKLSASLEQAEPSFRPLRNKIHNRPGADDAQAVRQFAAGLAAGSSAREFERLAGLIDSVYGAGQRSGLRANPKFPAPVAASLDAVNDAADDQARLAELSGLLRTIRDNLANTAGAVVRLDLLDLSLAAESRLFVLAAGLAGQPRLSRAARLELLRRLAVAAYGTGLISQRQLDALASHFDRLLSGATVPLADYKTSVDYLKLAPGWASQWMNFHFRDAVNHLARIEPAAVLFTQDLLRAGPMLSYARLLDGLVVDANALSGISLQLFGAESGGGLRALNPGVATGTLRFAGANTSYDRDGIYVLAETESDLPPVAGILTEGEGNALSHVQLLARNLGIPNVAIDPGVVQTLRGRDGERVTVAVSRRGSVRIDHAAPEAAAAPGGEMLIRPDLDKLDLEFTGLVKLDGLRATDSGRIVGPKAAKLGELQHHYPDAVARGLAIPFGVFRQILDRPWYGERTVFQWIEQSYAELAAMTAGSAERDAATESFRSELNTWIEQADPGDAFRSRLRATMEKVFGADGSYGVFVRSDTNVEDLPGFTGAGLNLTVANVVGFDNVVQAIMKVWASPFTERPFAWRQSRMDQPQHVYPAVLLLESVPSEKSGVLVTQDIETGDRNVLSVAVNEGVGGAVDGQSAEALRINMDTGDSVLLAQATATIRRRINPAGGLDKVPVSDSDRVLEPDEIALLTDFARELPLRFPAIVDDQGDSVPADVEFGFVNGELRLFQIRPFLESAGARDSALLQALDAGIRPPGNAVVDMGRVPGSS